MTSPISGDDAILGIARALHELAERATGLPSSDAASISVLIDAGEWSLALEVLCTQLYEYDLDLNAADFAALADLGFRLHVDVPRLLGLSQ